MPKKKYYDGSSGDGAMAGTGGFSGLPSGVIQKNYPKSGGYMPENLNDGLSGIDSQVSADSSSIKSRPSKSKF